MSEDLLYLKFTDREWPFEGITHVRPIARAVVTDGMGNYYFLRAERDDDFGNAVLIETSGGGIEAGETPEEAVHRELKEELGAGVTIIEKIGIVEDDYNLIHRHNVNHYFLALADSFGRQNLTKAEAEEFHLSVCCLKYEEAMEEYRISCSTAIGRLIAQRELPVLEQAGKLLEQRGYSR